MGTTESASSPRRAPFCEIVDDDYRGRSIEPLLDAVEQVHHRRRPHRRVVEDLGHVEADRFGLEVGYSDPAASLAAAATDVGAV